MVRFHLFGLVAVAVALAIQGAQGRVRKRDIPKPLYGLDWTLLTLRCRPKADETQHCQVRNDAPVQTCADPIDTDSYQKQCYCGGFEWWGEWASCLENLNSTWAPQIKHDRDRRCDFCNDLWGGDSDVKGIKVQGCQKHGKT